MTKFKVSFVVETDQLTHMIAVTDFRFLGDLRIVEIEEHPLPKAPPAVVALANQFKTRKKHARKKFAKPNLKEGMNRIIIEQLESQPRTNIELRDALVKGGYSPNSTTSQMQKLADRNIVRKTDRGVWELVVPAPE